MSETLNHPEPDRMIAAVHQYVAAFEKGSLDEIVALFAADATVEDPVGSDPIRGTEAIRLFYSAAVAHGTKLRLDGPIRVTREYAAFPFIVVAIVEGQEIRVEVIDTFRFDADNRVVEMRAYFGAVNTHGPALTQSDTRNQSDVTD